VLRWRTGPANQPYPRPEPGHPLPNRLGINLESFRSLFDRSALIDHCCDHVETMTRRKALVGMLSFNVDMSPLFEMGVF